MLLHLARVLLRHCLGHHLTEVFRLHLARGVLRHEAVEGLPDLLLGEAAGLGQLRHILLPQNWGSVLVEPVSTSILLGENNAEQLCGLQVS